MDLSLPRAVPRRPCQKTYYRVFYAGSRLDCVTSDPQTPMSTLVQSKQEIIDILKRYRVRLRNLGVQEIGLFGSFARGQQREDSDVDLLVKFDPDQKTFENLIRLSSLLEELLGRPVEVVTTEALSPYIGPHILREVENVDLAT